MGKASRRPRGRRALAGGPASVPFVARPFEGLPGETDWVAIREILPAATGVVRYAPGQAPEGAPATVTIASVLPMAWVGMRRAGGAVMVGAQSGGASGDASRDLAAAMLEASTAAEGVPVQRVPTPTVDMPRLQDLIDTSVSFEVTVHDGFDFWVAGSELDAEGQASLDRANESAIPTVRVEGAPSVYWCRIAERAYIRWILPYDEDAATAALARLHAAGRSRLDPESRLLGAFRACGLLVPVWELDPRRLPADHADSIAAMALALDTAVRTPGELSPDERRARAGLLNRQVTLR